MNRFSRLVWELTSIYRTCGAATAARYTWAIAANAREILRTGTLIPADKAMPDTDFHVRVDPNPRKDPVRVRLPGKFFGGGRELYCRNVYQLQLNFDYVVVDLGASYGLISALAATKGCNVIAVEAQAEFADALAVRTRGMKVAIERKLIGGKIGKLAGSDCESITMQELIDRHKIDTINFLKMDIEGSEFDLFNGDLDWLKKTKRIAMEVHTEFGDPGILRDILRDRGFDVHLRNNDLEVVDRIVEESGYLYAHC